MGVHLIGVYLTGVYLIGVYLTGVHLMGVYPISVYLTDVHLIDGHASDRHILHGHASYGSRSAKTPTASSRSSELAPELARPRQTGGFYFSCTAKGTEICPETHPRPGQVVPRQETSDHSDLAIEDTNKDRRDTTFS
jgi:hypothetical protein